MNRNYILSVVSLVVMAGVAETSSAAIAASTINAARAGQPVTIVGLQGMLLEHIKGAVAALPAGSLDATSAGINRGQIAQSMTKDLQGIPLAERSSVLGNIVNIQALRSSVSSAGPHVSAVNMRVNTRQDGWIYSGRAAIDFNNQDACAYPILTNNDSVAWSPHAPYTITGTVASVAALSLAIYYRKSIKAWWNRVRNFPKEYKMLKKLEREWSGHPDTQTQRTHRELQAEFGDN